MKAEFITSATNLKQCPPSSVPEIAFFGRSNVGKSSLINTLTERKTLAKASITPGKTRLINFFLIENKGQQFQIVDLPGYGYAKAGQKEKESWMDMTQNFITHRTTLCKVFLLIDASIPPQKIDLAMIETFREERINFDIVFTKVDKGTQKERHKTISTFKDFNSFQVSNKNGKGKDELLNSIYSITANY